MKSVKEIFGEYHVKHIWFYIGDDEKKKEEFLQYAADNNLTWMNGDAVNVSENNCGYIMGIDDKMHFGFVPLFNWTHYEFLGNKETVIRLSFTENPEEIPKITMNYMVSKKVKDLP